MPPTDKPSPFEQWWQSLGVMVTRSTKEIASIAWNAGINFNASASSERATNLAGSTTIQPVSNVAGTKNNAREAYTPDQQRAAGYIVEISGIGGGDDPVGFLIASHAALASRSASRSTIVEECAKIADIAAIGASCRPDREITEGLCRMIAREIRAIAEGAADLNTPKDPKRG